MNCIRCQEKPAGVSCECLVLRQNESYDPIAGGTKVTKTEYASGTETVGLCGDCAKLIAKTEPQLLYVKAYRTFARIWFPLIGACAALLAVWLFLSPGDTRTLLGRIGLYGGLGCLIAMGIFRLATQNAAAKKRSDRDKLLLAQVHSHWMQGKPIYDRYVPLCRELYPDFDAFSRINNGVMEQNKKSIYEQFIK